MNSAKTTKRSGTEEQKAGLAEGWIAFDRTGEIATTIQAKTRYDDGTRTAKIDGAVTSLDQILATGTPERVWQRLGSVRAFDRLVAAYSFLIDLLFAVNRAWRFWPERQMTYLLALPRLPVACDERLTRAITGPTDLDGYLQRVETLRSLLHDVLTELIAEGFYSESPISEAFVRTHDEPGRSWNLAEWNKNRKLP